MEPVSALDGHRFLETAFLSPDWHFEGLTPASNWYGSSEEAIWDMCPGCIHERGWLEMDHAEGDICHWMHEAQEYDGEPMVGKWANDKTGEWFTQCYYRQELWLQEEDDAVCEGQTAFVF